MDRQALEKLDDIVARHDSFIHVTHVNPDADGLGSALAMHRWLRSKGKRSEVVVPSPVPRKIAFLVQPGEVRVVADASTLPSDAVYVMYDVANVSRLGGVAAAVRASKRPLVVFDHHDGAMEVEAVAIVEEGAGATAQVVFDVLARWGAEITIDLAIPLYVAIVADTGSFNYGKTTPHTHDVAARLLRAGVDPLAIHGQLEGNRTLEAVRAGGEVLETLTVDPADARLAHATMTVAQYCGGGSDALEMLDLVNHTIALSGVLAGVLFIAAEPRLTRLSLRSKGDTSVVEVARAFGGGGHRNAAGATIQEPLEAVRDAVLSELRASLARQHGAAAG